MASETVDPIDWSHPSTSWAVPPEIHVLHGVNAAYKLQNLLQQPGLEHAYAGMPDQRTACAATQRVLFACYYFKKDSTVFYSDFEIVKKRLYFY